MANEFLNNHRHDAGWFHCDWDYGTDKSIDAAAAHLNAVAHDGVSADEVLEVIKSALDFEQLTDREARQLSACLSQHYDQMTPEAKAIAERFDVKLQTLVNDLHDGSDERLSGFRHAGGWFGENLRSDDPEAAVLEGDDLTAFIADLERGSARSR